MSGLVTYQTEETENPQCWVQTKEIHIIFLFPTLRKYLIKIRVIISFDAWTYPPITPKNLAYLSISLKKEKEKEKEKKSNLNKLLTDTKTKLPPSFTLVTVSNLWLIQSLNSHSLLHDLLIDHLIFNEGAMLGNKNFIYAFGVNLCASTSNAWYPDFNLVTGWFLAYRFELFERWLTVEKKYKKHLVFFDYSESLI